MSSCEQQRQDESYLGFCWRRVDEDEIRISWGTPSGISVSTKNTLSREFNEWDRFQEFPILCKYEGIWMYEVQTDLPVSFVNVRSTKFSDELKRAVDIKKLVPPKDQQMASTRFASRNFLYLGWIVESEEDYVALKDAIKNRNSVDLDEDIAAKGRTIRRLRFGVEQKLLNGEETRDKLDKKKRSVPIMFERPKDGNDFHVLFLDGHIEEFTCASNFFSDWKFLFDDVDKMDRDQNELAVSKDPK